MGHYLTYVLIPDGTENIEGKILELMVPYHCFHKVPAYKRQCECVFNNAEKAVGELGREKFPNLGPNLFKFTKEEYERDGFAESQLAEMMNLGHPDSDCEQCGGTGSYITIDTPEAKWDGCSIGTGFAEGILKDCIKSSPSNPNIVPVRDLDLKSLPAPHHILNPEGIWFSEERFLWSKPVMVIDENWTETVRTLLENHEDSTLVVLNVHF
jgi:hypothetical protein